MGHARRIQKHVETIIQVLCREQGFKCRRWPVGAGTISIYRGMFKAILQAAALLLFESNRRGEPASGLVSSRRHSAVKA